MEGTLELPAVVGTNCSDLKPSVDDVAGNVVLQFSGRAVNGVQERGHLGTGYGRPQ